MANEKKINLNNGDSVVKNFEEETFSSKFASSQENKSVVGEVTITDENITNNAKLIVHMFD